jgi:hypothetical protein
MGKLKPIGSEKLEGLEKIQRIMEIARYKENTPNPINEVNSNHYNVKLVDGNIYHIEKEKNGYVIKKTVNEGQLEYLEPMRHRKYYQSYSQAFKRLNLIVKEVNQLHGNDEHISLFNEQKKFVLKTPKSDTPVAPPAPVSEPVAPPAQASAAPMPTDDMGMAEPTGDEMPTDDMGMAEPTGDEMPTDDMGMAEPTGDEMPADDMEMGQPEDDGMVSFKTIQKLTGKLGQKLRKINQGEEPISADDTKYVINSILSALDLSVLSDEDMEEIIGRLEDSEFESEDETDMEEPEMEEPSDEMESGMEEPSDEMSPEIPEGEMTEEEMNEYIEGMIGGEYDLGFRDEPKEMNYPKAVANAYAKEARNQLGDMLESDDLDGVENIFDSVFSESKVDGIIKSYFVETDSEKKFIQEQKQKKFLTEKAKKIKIMREVKNLSESFQQESSSSKFLNRYSKANFVGKTNKKNLVFEVNGKQYKITPHGAIL